MHPGSPWPCSRFGGILVQAGCARKASCSADTTDSRELRIWPQTQSHEHWSACHITGMGTSTKEADGMAWVESVGHCWAEGKLVNAAPILGPPGGDITSKAWQVHLLLITSTAFWGRRFLSAFLLLTHAERGWDERVVSSARTARAVPGASPFQHASQAFKTPASFRSCAGHGLIGTNRKRT